MHIARASVLTIIGMLFGAHAAVAQPVACGDTLGPGSSFVLAGDVLTCASGTDPALTLVGPVKVDMAGFRVRCDPNDPPVGIRLAGKGVKLSNGGARDCVNSLLVEGEGSHKVEYFAGENASEYGVRVESDKNKFTHVSSNENEFHGFEVRGSGNKLENVTASNNEVKGIDLDGDKNQLKRALVAANASDGVQLTGSTNKVKDCFAASNGVSGIDIEGDKNKVEKCIVSQNGAEDPNSAGIVVDGFGNQVKNNLANDNFESGIVTEATSTGSKITKNGAIGNATLAGDLADQVAGGACGSNQWKKNIFGTSKADGNDDPACIE